MNHLEIEYKTLLTKDEYNRLAVLFSHVTPVTQTITTLIHPKVT